MAKQYQVIETQQSETGDPRFIVYGYRGDEVAVCIRIKDADIIATAMNSQPKLLAACKAIRNVDAATHDELVGCADSDLTQDAIELRDAWILVDAAIADAEEK